MHDATEVSYLVGPTTGCLGGRDQGGWVRLGRLFLLGSRAL